MGRTVNPQVALYLTPDKVELLREIARKSGKTQQELLREGVDLMLAKHRTRARTFKKVKA